MYPTLERFKAWMDASGLDSARISTEMEYDEDKIAQLFTGMFVFSYGFKARFAAAFGVVPTAVGLVRIAIAST